MTEVEVDTGTGDIACLFLVHLSHRTISQMALQGSLLNKASRLLHAIRAQIKHNKTKFRHSCISAATPATTTPPGETRESALVHGVGLGLGLL